MLASSVGEASGRQSSSIFDCSAVWFWIWLRLCLIAGGGLWFGFRPRRFDWRLKV